MEPTGKKIMARGRRLENGDLDLLAKQGIEQVWVVSLAPDERSEDHILEDLLPVVGQGSFEIKQLPGGRADFIARDDSALVLHVDRLFALNSSGVGVLCAAPQFARLKAGQRFAQFRTRPFGAPAERLQALRELLGHTGACFDVKPIFTPRVTVLYTDPVRPEKARGLFESAVTARAKALDFIPHHDICVEDEEPLTRAFHEARERGTDLVLVASTMAPSTPEDVIGRAMAAAGAHIEHYLAPVEPGSLMMIGYAGQTAVLSAPGCFRSTKTNGVDVILPALLARHRLTATVLSSLGPGGLLE